MCNRVTDTYQYMGWGLRNKKNREMAVVGRRDKASGPCLSGISELNRVSLEYFVAIRYSQSLGVFFSIIGQFPFLSMLYTRTPGCEADGLSVKCV